MEYPTPEALLSLKETLHPNADPKAIDHEGLLLSTLSAFQGLEDWALKGAKAFYEAQLIEKEALDQIARLSLSQLPVLQSTLAAGLMQQYLSPYDAKILTMFDKACKTFAEGETDLALGMFLALLFFNPLIASVWYAIAKAFENKGDFHQSLYSYAIAQLLNHGNPYSALDAATCLAAAGKIRLAQALLYEIEASLQSLPFNQKLHERIYRLKQKLKI